MPDCRNPVGRNLAVGEPLADCPLRQGFPGSRIQWQHFRKSGLRDSLFVHPIFQLGHGLNPPRPNIRAINPVVNTHANNYFGLFREIIRQSIDNAIRGANI